MSNRRLTPGLKLLDYVRDSTGSLDKAWFARGNLYVKPNQPEHPCVLVNEFLCSRLAYMLGLPAPIGDLALDAADNLVWASALVSLNGQEPGPADPDKVRIAEPDVVAGMCVFDTWIANADRHDDNVIFHPKIGLWLFDHDQALGGPKTNDLSVLTGSRDRALSYHLFRGAALDEKHVRSWVVRVRSVPASAILRLVQQGVALSLYSTDVRDGIMEFLEHRRQRLPQLVRKSLDLKDNTVLLDDSRAAAPGGETTT